MIPRSYGWIYAGVLILAALCCSDGFAAESCYIPHLQTVPNGFRYGFSPQTKKKGLIFMRKRIPIGRRDVGGRILKELNYLLMDRRSLVLLWLSRSDEYRGVILPILRKYKLPPEFLYLAAIESSYDPRSLSSAGAYGYWQFIRPTAKQGPHNCPQYDWKMKISGWNDERGDLVKSTHSAARYLAWMNRVMKVKLNGAEREGLHNWLLATASYNAGPNRVLTRLNLYDASSYWDVPLPIETERYVPRLIAVALISRDRAFYGVDVPKRKHRSFDTVRGIRLNKNLQLADIAKLVGTTPRAVWELNGQIPHEKAVFPAKTGRHRHIHTINVPEGTRQKFLTKLKAHGYVGK